MRVLLENTIFLLQTIFRIAGTIRVVVIIRGRASYEEIRYLQNVDLWKIGGKNWVKLNSCRNKVIGS